MAIDDVAVTWSNYESFRTTIEYDTRHKIASEITRVIERCKQNGMNNHFIAGMELAQGVVSGLVDIPKTKEELNHPSLF